jgi:dTDP-glucose 4,6-dehydratase
MNSSPISFVDLDLILAQTRELWDEMRGQRVFITGGTGFFGCWLVESFCHINRELELGAQVTVLSRNPAKFSAKAPHLANDPAVTLHVGDVRNFDFPTGEFRFVIHAATETTGMQASDELYSTIVSGTERTLDFASQSGTRKFLLASSGAVYGTQPTEITHLSESYACAPDQTSAYALGKLASEQLCAERQQAARAKGVEFEAKIARCWAFCGPHLPLDAHFAIGNFIGDALAGRAISIGGDGTPRRSYLYAADLATWLWTILFRAPTPEPINVGSAHDVSIRELAEIVAATLAPATTIHTAKQAVAGATVSRYVPSVERAENLLGLRATVDLAEAIRRTTEWHRRADQLQFGQRL